MVRITKLTDYAMVILAYMANNPDRLFQAKEIATVTTIALPTVSKLLKNLTKSDFLCSERGATGGYRLKYTPEQIHLVELIEALEGPLAITECNLGHNHCQTEQLCPIRKPWHHINQVITKALAPITLSDFILPHTNSGIAQ